MIVAAKLVVPTIRPGTLQRTRLDAALEAAANRQLTVVRAPAGYGKTTAVALWLAVAERPAAWVGLDRHDNEPRRLLAHLLAALGPVLPMDALSAAERALRGGSDPGLTVIPLLAEALYRDGPPGLTIVLDDVHVIHAEEARAAVLDLLDALPPAVHTLVTSRTRPALRLARRLAAGDASLIGPEQLAFDQAETALLLNGVHQLALSDDDLGDVLRRLHGWSAGLGLLVTALQLGGGEARSGLIDVLGSMTRGELVDYVVEEVLTDADPAQQRFLLHTSVLRRFNPSLAEAVTGDPDAGELFERLREEGLFVTADAHEGGWLAVHDLIRQALLVALGRLEPGAEPGLRARAAAWLASHGLVTDALDQGIRAGEFQLLARCIRAHGIPLVFQRQTAMLRRAIDLVRAAQEELDPVLAAIDLFVRLQEGAHPRTLAAEAWELHEAHADQADVQVITSAMVSMPLFGDIKRSILAGLAARERFGHLPHFAARLDPAVAASLLWEDRIDEARALLEPMISSGRPLGRIVGHGLLAYVGMIDRDPVEAERHARRAVGLLEESGFETAAEFSWVHASLAEALRVAGKLQEARAELTISLELEGRRPGGIGQAGLLLTDARLAIAERRRGVARARLQSAVEILGTFPDIGSRIRSEVMLLQEELAAPVDSAGRGSAPTEAERRVLAELACSGHRGQIAARLFLSESTVKSHLRRLYKRLGAHSRAEALAAARELGLLPPATPAPG